MLNYQEKIKEILLKTPIEEKDVFYYNETPMEEEFEKIYQFYSETLKLNSYYGIDPSYIYFNNSYSINAYAGKINNTYLISINMGTIHYLMKKFGTGNDLIDKIEDKTLKAFLINLDSPVSDLMYQNALHFTFYHELGHLIQNSDLLENKLFERVEESSNYSLKKHILEFDADEYSSICIASHTVQYANVQFNGNLDSSKIEYLLVLICSSVFFYLLSFSATGKNIYYNDHSHPHPLIRITYIIFVIAGHCISTFKQQGQIFNIDIRKVVDRTLDFSLEINSLSFQDDRITNYSDIISKEADKIMNYIMNLRKSKEGDDSLAVSKWNAYVRTLNH